MGIKSRLSPMAIAIIAVIVAGVAIGGTIYFYILPQQSGNYSGPGLPNPGVTTSFSISVPGYGDWADYAFHSNVTDFWANVSMTGLSGSYGTATWGLMNQSGFDNLSSNTSIQWMHSEAFGANPNWQLTASGNYYIVLIQEGNGNVGMSGTLTLTEISA